MKILFLTYHGFEEASGISKKMLAQIKGLRQNGHEVHVCSYDYAEDGSRCRFVDNKVIQNYGKGRWATIRQRVDYSCINNYCRKNGIELVYVRSFMNASPFNIRLFKRLKQDGVKCVMEIPTYPYDKEFESLPFKHTLGLWVDKLFRRELASYMDAIVTFSDYKMIFGQKTINISNGVDFDLLPLHRQVINPSELHLIGVAEVHPWHGFDRMIHGLGEYYKCGEAEKKPVYFHIVGNVWPPEMNGTKNVPGFLPIMKEYGIEDKVIFHGQLFGKDLDAVFDQCSFGVGSLARHRSGISVIKTLKNREYACRGIPFIYSEQDSDFDTQPYVLKASPDESPIRVQEIVDFCQSIPNASDIRKTVEHLSWNLQMQKVLENVKS
ncbi:MAG: glycosyltransferase family 4 protein [Prevotella sp.]|nr:glycosyltransferase family 4 protein [Prevotella sp.]